jgi:hypothetical protein
MCVLCSPAVRTRVPDRTQRADGPQNVPRNVPYPRVIRRDYPILYEPAPTVLFMVVPEYCRRLCGERSPERPSPRLSRPVAGAFQRFTDRRTPPPPDRMYICRSNINTLFSEVNDSDNPLMQVVVYPRMYATG